MQTLRALRESRGLSQYDLARIAGVTQPAVAQLENGTLCVGAEKRGLIASAVGVTPEEIAWDGPEWKLAEAHRLIGRAMEDGGRAFVLRAMPLLMMWLARTRPIGAAETVMAEGGDDDATR